jgi:hypothetical protein
MEVQAGKQNPATDSFTNLTDGYLQGFLYSF